MTTFVIASDGTKLMPTTNIKKVRKLLKSKRAIIHCYKPFTIQLKYDTTKVTQPVELAIDAGYVHIGLSVKSDKHEFVSAQYDTLTDEVERHNNQFEYRRARRNHKTRYRKARFNNRKSTKKSGWLAPSLQHKLELHVQLFKTYNKVTPITNVIIEIAQFDTQLLEAIEKGLTLPTGTMYQMGARYGYDTLREAVFARDNHKCICCGKSSIKDGVILKVHHLGYLNNDRSNRLNNLATVCINCHTAKNHKPGGQLYDLKPKLKTYKGAAFMNAIKYNIYNSIKNEFVNTHITYGTITKHNRNLLNIIKSHANDAYCIGDYRPKHRCITKHYKKNRRNNRVLEKFYDAKYIDIRDSKVKSGAQLSCGRTNRSKHRNNIKNERLYRGNKISKGRRSIRRTHYSLRPHDIVSYKGIKDTVVGVQNNGTYVKLKKLNKIVKSDNVTIISHVNGWIEVA